MTLGGFIIVVGSASGVAVSGRDAFSVTASGVAASGVARPAAAQGAPAPTQVPAPGAKAATIAWADCLEQSDVWYATTEAVRIADVVLLHQRANGGWAKNVDMARRLGDDEVRRLAGERALTDTTIDNGATVTQIRYLARVLAAADSPAPPGRGDAGAPASSARAPSPPRAQADASPARATRLPRVREGIARGIGFLLAAQYPNGGWPQYFPLRTDYSRHITYNDHAMIGVMELLRDVGAGQAPYGFLSAARQREATDAVARGLRVVLASQIRLSQTLTVWCAQHDEVDLRPRPARSYELASLSGSESVGIVRYLMSLEAPDPAVIRAVEAAANWFRRARIRGVRVDRVAAPSLPRGFDLVVVRDRAAPPIWGRFYDLETNQPFFCNRDGRVVHELAQLEYERRTGYSWLGPYATDLLGRDYPQWRQRIASRVP